MTDLIRTLTEEAANQYLATAMPYKGTLSKSSRDAMIGHIKELHISVIPHVFLEQYTKLVVQECFTKLAPYIDEFGIADVGVELKEHFGIKE